ncbi:uncharacterized protein LOC119562309 [Drosophila subpulchrella]|uniref:uncharacterized protein LOC119562309 n=1 Tax=Drosophila subpulchrella TaxID=1486046 RepID=UPI0018A18338|nr:uncharacterized protein LOC119562309 [Drosophila subpulchrella]
MANMSITSNGENGVIVSGQTIFSLSKNSIAFHGKERLYTELGSGGRTISRCLTTYECQLEDDVEQLQEALFKISSHYAKIQFGLRQVASASSSERDSLLKDLEDLTSQGLDDTEHSLDYTSSTQVKIRVKQNNILCQLRERLEELEIGVCFQQDCCPVESRSMITCEGATNNTTLCNIVDQDGGKTQECGFKAVGKSRPVGRNMQLGLYDMESKKQDLRLGKES